MIHTLEQVVEQHPYGDFGEWWPMGETFLAAMAEAIVSQWAVLQSDEEMQTVIQYASYYLQTVYARQARPALVSKFVAKENLAEIQSGEFDALSYAFYRSAFERLAQDGTDESLPQLRRAFTQRVGKAFFKQLAEILQLSLPSAVDNAQQFDALQRAIGDVGLFLQQQGYLRDHVAFRFDVDLTHDGQSIQQMPDDVVPLLGRGETAHALYEMGYPVILPSAVYLYHTMGEAQHHSSRIIEELFAQAGCDARETDDFDPTGYPSDLVVELWEIKKS